MVSEKKCKSWEGRMKREGARRRQYNCMEEEKEEERTGGRERKRKGGREREKEEGGKASEVDVGG
eukprot:6177013-Pleurochrysis_carterae.AAC.1